MMAAFDPNVNAQPPATLWDAVKAESDTSTKAYLCLERDPGQPHLQGTVTMVHSVQRYNQGLSCLANQWTDRVFGLTGDVLARNIPTVVEMDGTSFHLAPPAPVRSHRPEAVQLMLAA